MKRRDFTRGAITLGAVFFSSPSQAFLNCGSQAGAAGAIYQNDLYDGLKYLNWKPVGPQSKSLNLYSMIAPWCPFCTRLSMDALNDNLPFNLRVSPCEPRSFSDRQKIFKFINDESSDAVLRFHDRRPSSDVFIDNINLLNDIVNCQQKAMWSLRNWQSSIYPSLASGFPMSITDIGETGGIIVSGYSPEIIKMLHEDAVPFSLNLQPISMETLSSFSVFSRKDSRIRPIKEDVVMRTLPIPDAFPNECTPMNYSYSSVGTIFHSGREWFVLSANIADFEEVLMYASAEDFERF